MKIAWVIYGSNPEKRKQMKDALSGLHPEEVVIVNNAPGDAAPDEVQGSNREYEFSGYFEALKNLEGEGPFLILNDTLLKTHWQPGWHWFLQQAAKRSAFFPAGAIAGDIRWVKEDMPECPVPFLASWLFWCTDEVALARFRQALQQVIATEMAQPSPRYQAYLDNWFRPESTFRGWHGSLSDDSYARKLRCVRLEHTLSLVLSQDFPLHSLGALSPWRYRLLRLIDRGRTRWSAWRGTQR